MIEHFVTERLKSLYEAILTFLEKEMLPIEMALMDGDYDESEKILNEKRNHVKSLNLWALHLSMTHGGLGLSLLEFAQISELLGTTFFGHYAFNCQAPDVGNMELLSMFGYEHLQKNYMLPLMRGENGIKAIKFQQISNLY